MRDGGEKGGGGGNTSTGARALKQGHSPEALAVVLDATSMGSAATRAVVAALGELGNLLALGSAVGGRLRKPVAVMQLARRRRSVSFADEAPAPPFAPGAAAAAGAAAASAAASATTRLDTVCGATPDLNLRSWHRGLRALRPAGARGGDAGGATAATGSTMAVEGVSEHLASLSSCYDRVVVLSCALAAPSADAMERLRAAADDGLAIDFLQLETSAADADELAHNVTQVGLGGAGSVARAAPSGARARARAAAAAAAAAAALEAALLPLAHCTFARLSQDAASASRLARALWRGLSARPLVVADAVIDFPRLLQCGIDGGLGGGKRSDTSFVHVQVCSEVLGDVACGVQRCAVCMCHGVPLGRAPRVCRVSGQPLEPSQAVGAVRVGGAGVLRLPNDPAAARGDVYEDRATGWGGHGDPAALLLDSTSSAGDGASSGDAWCFNLRAVSGAADPDEPCALQAVGLVRLATLSAALMFGQPLVLRPVASLATGEGEVSDEEMFAAIAAALRRADAALLLRAPFDAPLDGRLGAPCGGAWVACPPQDAADHGSLLMRRVASAEEVMPPPVCEGFRLGEAPRDAVVAAVWESMREAFGGGPKDYSPFDSRRRGLFAGSQDAWLAHLALSSAEAAGGGDDA